MGDGQEGAKRLGKRWMIGWMGGRRYRRVKEWTKMDMPFGEHFDTLRQLLENQDHNASGGSTFHMSCQQREMGSDCQLL